MGITFIIEGTRTFTGHVTINVSGGYSIGGVCDTKSGDISISGVHLTLNILGTNNRRFVGGISLQ